MIYVLELVFIIVLLSVWWYKDDCKKYSDQPPGPARLPLFGNLFQVMRQSNFPAIALQKLASIYGDIMFLKMGQQETVVFCSPDAIQEVLTHNSTNGRTQFEAIRDRHNDKNLGIIWGHGKSWQMLRRFTMRNLRDYGFGKSSEMDAVVNEEVEKFVKHIRYRSSKAPERIIHVKDLFDLTLLNVIWRLVSGKSYDYSDAKMLHLLKLNDQFFKSTNFGLDITHVFPILRDWFPNWSGRTIQKKSSEALFNYGKELLDEHRKINAIQDDPQCFIDVFAAKLDSSKEEPDTDFNDEQFVMTILDLLVGGSETSSKTLSFGILYMLLNPEVQEKVQQELDREVPFGPIDSTMKSRLPYTSATILEMLRYSTILPLPSAREATENFDFRGYHIKKGTCLMTNVYAVHFSESLWGDPQNFRPERFLNSAGTAIDKKMADSLASFGAGKRFCLGQSLAETTIFIYFSTMLRHFQFVKVPGTNPSTDPILGITNCPQPYDVKIIPRESKQLIGDGA